MGVQPTEAYVQRDPIIPDLGGATKIQTAAVEVSAPVTIGEVTTFEVDGSVAGTLSYLLPLTDPAGEVIAGPPFTWPRIYVEAVVAPVGDFRLMAGMSDDALLVQYLVAGLRFDTVNPKATLDAHNVGPADGTAVVGGNSADFEALAGVSLVSDATFVQTGRCAALIDGLPGFGAGQVLATNDHWAGAPHFLVQIISPGGLGTVMFSAKINYLSHFRQSALGGA